MGYQVGMEERQCNEDTLLVYCTTGVLLEKFVHQSASLADITHVVVDEVHERDLDTDLLLLVLKQFLHSSNVPHPFRFKLILMSATIQAGPPPSSALLFIAPCPTSPIPLSSTSTLSFHVDICIYY